VIASNALWSQIRDRYSSEVELKTISTRREFKVVYDGSHDEVIVMPLSTKMPRYITRRDFQRVWEKFAKVEMDPYRPGHYQRETQNASYILALIKDVLGEGDEQQSLKPSQEEMNLLRVKSMKGSFTGIVKSTWNELEETIEKFVKEGQR